MHFLRFLICICGLFFWTACSDSFEATPTANSPVAPFALGQVDTSSSKNLKNGLNRPTSMAVAGSRLFVADSVNNRVLGWNSIPTSSAQAPDFVLGQPDFTTNFANFGGVSASSMNMPVAVHSDGTRLFVVDNGNSRVLIWNAIPSSNGKAADVVVGQPDFTSSVANNDSTTPGTPSASNLYYPTSVFSDGTHLVVADSSNNRVLIWNAIPSANGAAANVVLGQPNFNSNAVNNDHILGAGNVSAETLSGPQGVLITGSYLMIADSRNHRVLIFNSIPSSHQTSADVVIGQIDKTHSSANSDGTGAASSATASSLNGPFGVSSDGARIFVADVYNNRVLIFNAIPAADYPAANVVIGQSSMTSVSSPSSSSQDPTAATLDAPLSVLASGGGVWISDYIGNRVLKFNNVPSGPGTSADLILGQPTATLGIADNGQISASTLNTPQDVFSIGSQFFAADYGNNRVLIWNSLPTSSNASASVVLGQSSMSTATVFDGGLITARSLNSPTSVASDGTRLVVADFNNNRVLIWNSIPTSSYTNANVVLGQTNMTSNGINQGGSASAQTLQFPYAVRICNGKLVVSDAGNNRVLIWNSIPTASNAAADVVLGQANATSTGMNRDPGMGAGTTAADTLNSPSGITCSGTKLFVSDTQNHRVLIWNTFPTVTGAAADVVIGQSSFSGNSSGTSSSTLNQPVGLWTDGTELFIADAVNNRVLRYKSIPTANGQPADQVYGQTDFSTGTAVHSLSSSSLRNPVGLFKANSVLYISDNANSRILGLTP